MNKTILSYIEECEAWKVAIKSLHWDSASLSQHELCDDIASDISDFEDLVSEVEQSMSGKLPINTLKPKNYKIKSLKSFVEDVISSTQAFLKNLEKMGKKYVGIKSECETFIGVMQRKLYLVNFTLKEDLKKRIRASINESRPKSITPETEFEKLRGRRPKSIKTRISHIYKIISMYGIDRKRYTDENWQAVDDYRSAISSLGCDVEIKPCANLANSDSIESDGGYCDYDPTDNMPRSKQYAIRITYGDGMVIDGYIKCMACGTMSDPFSTYDTCIVLWPKSNNKLTENNMRIDERKLKRILHESTVKAIRMIKEMNELYSEWYEEEDYNGNTGEEGMIRSYDVGMIYLSNAELEAKEYGYKDVAEYLESWFNEVRPDCPWYWTKVGSGYGYNGTTIFTHDGIVCKDIYGQIMFDEYPIGDARRNQQA